VEKPCKRQCWISYDSFSCLGCEDFKPEGKKGEILRSFFKKTLLQILIVLSLLVSGCAIHAVDVKTLTIPPSPGPTTVTVKGTCTGQDYLFFYRITEQLEIKSSDGTKAERVQ
jgi:hypothetical protein